MAVVVVITGLGFIYLIAEYVMWVLVFWLAAMVGLVVVCRIKRFYDKLKINEYNEDMWRCADQRRAQKFIDERKDQ